MRRLLREEHGIVIPDDTWFVGGYHDTTSDLVELYDTEAIPASHMLDFKRVCGILDDGAPPAPLRALLRAPLRAPPRPSAPPLRPPRPSLARVPQRAPRTRSSAPPSSS